MNFTNAILTAIIARERTGKGQRLVTSQTGAMVRFQLSAWSRPIGEGPGTQKGRPTPQGETGAGALW